MKWRNEIKQLWPFIIIGIMSFYFFTKQCPIPLLGDQLIYGTIIERLQHPEWLANDPLYGIKDIYLPLNLGIFFFSLLTKYLPPIEIGIIYGLTIIMFFYLVCSYKVFYNISKSSCFSLALSLLSALPIWMPGSTLWGIGLSDTFLSRTLFLPLVPIFFYFFLKMANYPTKKKVIFFYTLLGLAAYIHQISSVYLFLTFWVSLLIIRPKLIILHFISLICWLIPLIPYLVYHFYHVLIHPSVMSIPPSILQKWIEIRYSWAFNPVIGRETFNFLVQNPILIAILCIVPLLFKKEKYIIYLKVVIISLIFVVLSLYWIQYFLFNNFHIPFKFVELGRGLRFLPFIAFLLLSYIWNEIKVYFSSESVSIGISVCLLIFAGFMFISKYALLNLKYAKISGFTCNDSIFKKINTLSPNILIATDEINNLRYCSKHSVYVIFKDGAVAFYNGQEQFVKWIKRFILNKKFFETGDSTLLTAMKNQGVTHIFTKREFSQSELEKIYCSSNYCLYKIKK